METVVSILFFLIGFFILIKGAGVLVSGASSIARIFNISNWFIGVVIVGIGTSIPELSINIASVFNGNTIGLGTIIGSNTFNILFILGLSSLFYPIAMKREWVLKDFIFNILAIVAASTVIIFPIFGEGDYLGVTRYEGGFLLGFFFLWIFFMFRRKQEFESSGDYKIFVFITSLIMIFAGIIGVFLGGRWVVGGAETIARLFGVSDALIGLTIVAVGTSLPELAVSITALIKRRVDIAVGNIVGSNIFDFLGIIGITAMIKPIQVFSSVRFDIVATLFAALALFAMTFIGRKYILSRFEGLFFVSMYFLYILIVIWKG